MGCEPFVLCVVSCVLCVVCCMTHRVDGLMGSSHLVVIWEPFGSHLGTIWRSFGSHLGDHLERRLGAVSVTLKPLKFPLFSDASQGSVSGV